MKYYIIYAQWRTGSKSGSPVIPIYKKYQFAVEVINFFETLKRDVENGWSFHIIQIIKGEEMKIHEKTGYELQQVSHETTLDTARIGA